MYFLLSYKMSTASGMKGSDVYTIDGVGNYMLALSALLLRRVDVIQLSNMLDGIFKNPLTTITLDHLRLLPIIKYLRVYGIYFR